MQKGTVLTRRWPCVVALVLVLTLPAWSVDSNHPGARNVRYIGRVIGVEQNEFRFRTHWHPSRTVHVENSTVITCGKQQLPVSSVHLGDLVEVKAEGNDAEMWGTRIKLLIPNKECSARASQ